MTTQDWSRATGVPQLDIQDWHLDAPDPDVPLFWDSVTRTYRDPITLRAIPTAAVPGSNPHADFEAARDARLRAAEAKHAEAAGAQGTVFGGFKEWFDVGLLHTSKTIEAVKDSPEAKAIGTALTSLTDTPKWLALAAVGVGVVALVLQLRR